MSYLDWLSKTSGAHAECWFEMESLVPFARKLVAWRCGLRLINRFTVWLLDVMRELSRSSVP